MIDTIISVSDFIFNHKVEVIFLAGAIFGVVAKSCYENAVKYYEKKLEPK